jgi:beta-barrel assembly-enhancing protease
METIAATWYDGNSSRPVNVFLNIDLNANSLLITSDEREGSWSFQNIKVQFSGNTVHIYNNLLIGQSIETDNVVFGKVLLKFAAHSGDKWYYRILHAGIGVHLLIALGIIGFIVTSYFYAVPWIAEKAVDIIPESYDTGMGENFYDTYIQQAEIDSTLTSYVQQYADQINFGTINKPVITVVQSDDMNAFALPGGHIVIFTPIIASMTDYTELAALLSHEAAHVKKRHSMKMLCRNLSGYLLISALFSDVNGIIAVVADNANQLRMLSYSRGFEEEADNYGWQILKNNKINPQGLVTLFSHLKDKNSNEIPDFLSTHPLTDKRISDMKKVIKYNPFRFVKHSRLEELFLQIRNNQPE